METRNCQNCKNEFTIYTEDVRFYELVKIPLPTFCPDCRAQRRFIWRNERSLYRRACDLCQKVVIGLYPEGTAFPVYCRECWYGDGWDPGSYAMDYDSKVPFFAQFKTLMSRVPRLAIWTVACTNSEY